MHQYSTYIQPILTKTLNEYRQKCEYSQEIMAEKLRISPRSYGDLERGKSILSGPSLLFLLLAMDETEQLAVLKSIQIEIQKLEYKQDPSSSLALPRHK